VDSPPAASRRAARGTSDPGTPRALRVGSLFGAPIYVAPSWLLFLGWVTIAFGPRIGDTVAGIGSAKYAVSMAFGIFLGLSVLAHEIGHCVLARLLDVPVERVVLTWLAGHSAFEREPATPRRMVAVAVAGPAVNLALAAAAWVGYRSLEPGTVAWVLTAGLAWTNALVGVYNLLPGLPLDGGQVLRAVVWAVTRNERTGTIGAAWAGRLLGFATGLFGVYLLTKPDGADQSSGLWALLIAGMIVMSSTAVLRQQGLHDRVPQLDARGLTRRALAVPADLPLAEAVRRAQESNARGLVVVDGAGRPTGVVSEAAVSATPLSRRPWVSTGSVSRAVQQVQFVPAQLAGEALLRRLQQAPASEYIVVDPDGAIAGVLAAADVAAALKA
jgi:Zn-dependent protease/CBS domain-containing protein